MKANLVIVATLLGVAIIWILNSIGTLSSSDMDQVDASPKNGQALQAVSLGSDRIQQVKFARRKNPSVDQNTIEVEKDDTVLYENEGDLPPSPVALATEEVRQIIKPETSNPTVPATELPKIWRDKSKKFSTAATLQGFNHEHGMVSLLKTDGASVSIALDKLSDEDQEAVLNIAGPRVDPIAKALFGKVTEVLDGDTLRVTSFSEFTKTIRLNEVDAPELDQPFGVESKKELHKLCHGKKVRIEFAKVDQLGRISGEVFVDDLWVNGYLVANGFAWRYERYAKNLSLSRLDGHARATKSGLWAIEPCISPEAWRGGVRPLGINGVDGDDGVLYLTNKKLFYHFPGCRYLTETSIEIPERIAKEMYPPCSFCIPKEGKRD